MEQHKVVRGIRKKRVCACFKINCQSIAFPVCDSIFALALCGLAARGGMDPRFALVL